VKAFKIQGIDLHLTGTLEVNEEDDIVEEEELRRMVEEDEEATNNQTTEEDKSSGLERNACLAHLTQLAIKDAITSSEFVTDLIKRINELIAFFHRSNQYYTRLKQCNGNKALVKPCVTRWNAQYSCFQRIIETTDGNVSTTIKTIKLKIPDASGNKMSFFCFRL
jgi:hypothetical protein